MQVATQGSLFSSDFLTDAIREFPEWKGLDDTTLDAVQAKLVALYSAFHIDHKHTEADTETQLIYPALESLGWTARLTQQNLSAAGRDDIPDAILFGSDADMATAQTHPEQWKRYSFARAVVESKRWDRPLDRQSGKADERTAPSTQMLRYLRRVDDVTQGKLRWGILTNGAKWRLYFAGARSVSEQFFELDLSSILNLPNRNTGPFALSPEECRHWLRVFVLMFGTPAFIPTGAVAMTLHQRALERGKLYEERVATDLSQKVFEQVFPELVQALAKAAPKASLQEIREGALILLYRLLFILYAEDRDLLPVKDPRFDDYCLRNKVRLEVGARKDRGDTFSDTISNYWNAMGNLFLAIDQGDASIGLPPYNGGLFDQERNTVLANIRIPDSTVASIIDALSFENTPEGRKYINYRNLTVQQLGSIYERLLEFEVTQTNQGLAVQPNIFARKGSGSYYTPDDLVQLILTETLDPPVTARKTAFADEIAATAATDMPPHSKISAVSFKDPASRLLDMKICDPAMGSGHFLVSLVDYLSDQVIEAMADATAQVPEDWGDYVSPLAARIEAIRTTIMANARARNWTIDETQLDDRHIVRRMVLKRCIYGADKNGMAVELAKVALWLHTFTVGAPLSFLDHHLRCGDSLFGAWVSPAIEKAMTYGSPLLLAKPIAEALRAATKMQLVEGLTDAEIAEAHRSATLFDEIKDMTAPLDALMSLIHALDWLDIKDKAAKDAVKIYFDGQFGDPLKIAMGIAQVDTTRPEGQRFADIMAQARELIDEERFLNWQVAFPGIWSDWEVSGLTGGFDAIIGNPPWDRMKLQQVEWFAERRPAIAMAQRASDRARMVTALEKAGDPLAGDFAKASARAIAGTRMARAGGDYPLLSGGDINLYSLFVERAMTLVSPAGLIGLVVPSGIASDLTAAKFFKGVATEGRLKALYDFENKKVFFPDVHASFKFCTIIAGKSRLSAPAKCAFYLHNVSELQNPDTCFTLTAADFAAVNPNTGTAPIFRSRRDASLTTAIYARLPILVDRSSGAEVKAWPVKYMRMFDMTNDSGLFRTKAELEDTEGAYPIGGNIYDSASGKWVPLYEGKMVQAYDHRAASVVVNPENQHRPAQPEAATDAQHANPAWLPDPQFWVNAAEVPASVKFQWSISYKMITAPTNMRTIIAAALPLSGLGNSMGAMLPEADCEGFEAVAPLMLGNLNAAPFDFVIRQKVQGQNINWFIVEQLPVIPPALFETTKFGPKTAADIVRAAVLELTYTAHDMAPFARDMGYVDKAGAVLPPFIWDEARRLRLRAKLDAVFFHLYGITDRDDVKYIYSTFPIVEREETAAHGRYLSRDLCLAYMNALAAGNPDAMITL